MIAQWLKNNMEKKFTKKEIRDISEFLWDVYLLKIGEKEIKEMLEDYSREICLLVANRLFQLNIPEVMDINSANYVSEAEILAKLAKAVK